MEFLPSETSGTLGQFLALKDILALTTTNQDFQKTFLKPSVNTQLADYFGFPYGLTLVELKKYEEMSLQERLNAAAKTGDMRVVKKVIELHEENPSKISSGPDIVTGNTLRLRSRTTLNFNTPLKEASAEGHLDVVKYLVEKGAKNLNGALSKAVDGGHEKIVEYLIEKGVNSKNILDEELSRSAYMGHGKIVDILISHGANHLNEALKAAAYNNREEIVEKLVQHGADDFKSVIVRAIHNENEKLFYRFLELAGDINDTGILYGIVAYALRLDNAEIADQAGRKLYALGMDITPNQMLLEAALYGRIKVAEKMIQNGANDPSLLYEAYNIAKQRGYDKFAERIEEIYKSLSQ